MQLLAIILPQEVTSLYPVTLSTAPPKLGERHSQVTSHNPIASSMLSFSCQHALFDTGALTSESVLSVRLYEKLLKKGITAPLQPVETKIKPFVGSAQAALGRTRLTLTVADVNGLYHSAVIPFIVLPMDHFDVIVNNIDCRKTFSQFFYTSANWTVISNPYKQAVTEEDIPDIDIDLYGVNSASNSLDYEWDELYNETPELLGLLRDPDPPMSQSSHIPEYASNFASVFLPVSSEGIRVPPIKITTSSLLPPEIKAKARMIRRDIEPKVLDTLRQYSKEGLHVPSESVYASPIVPIVKPDGSVRLAVDYATGINQYITTPSTPIPLIKDIVHKLAQFSIFAEIDLTKAYRQLKIDDESSNLLSYITPLGQFRPLSLPEGVRSAPHIFVQIMYEIFKGTNTLDESIVIYFDNIYIGAMNAEELQTKITRVLEICAKYNIKLKPEKCKFQTDTLTCLGYVIHNHTITPDPVRVTALQTLRSPNSKKELRSILGSFLLYGSFIQGYASLVAPLYELLKNDTDFVWTSEHQLILDTVKGKLVEAIAIHYPDHSKDWVLMTDGSLTGIGGVLIQLQRNPDGSVEEQIIGVTSKKLSSVAQKWSIYEIELYALVYCIKQWANLLYGKSFEALVDHNNLLFMHQNTLAKVERWKTFLSDFHFNIRIIKGIDNVIADMLSRVNALQELEALTVNTQVEVTDAYIKTKHEGLGQVDHHPSYRTFEIIRGELSRDDPIDLKHLLQRVKDTVDSCIVCQKNKYTADTLVKQYRSLAVDQSFAAISMDIFGPLDRDAYGNAYVMAVKDMHDRFSVFYPIPDKAESHYMTCLLKYCSMFNIPRFIRTDNGGEFTSELCQSLDKFLRVSHTTTLPYTPTGNAMVERGNKELGHKLRLYCHQTNLRAVWSEALPLIQCSINNSFNRMIGMSPFICRFGSRAALYPSIIDMPISSYGDMDIYVRRLNDMLQSVNLVSDIISNSEQLRLASNSPELDRSIRVGDYVLQQVHLKPGGKLPNKLGIRWLGPHKITKIKGNVVTIQSTIHGIEHQADVSSLKHCIVRDPNDILTAANMDLQLLPKTIYDCSFIKHRGQVANFMDMQFKVEFANGAKLWTPYSYARHHPAFVSYIQKHGLSSILDSNGEPRSLSDYELKKWRKTRAAKILKESQISKKGIKDEYIDDVHKLFLDPTLDEETSKDMIPVSKKHKKVVFTTDSSIVHRSKPTYSFARGDYDKQYTPRIRRDIPN